MHPVKILRMIKKNYRKESCEREIIIFHIVLYYDKMCEGMVFPDPLHIMLRGD